MSRDQSFWHKKLSLIDIIIYKLRTKQILKHCNFDDKVIVDAGCWHNALFLQHIKKKYAPKKLIAFDMKLNHEELKKQWILTQEWNLNEDFNLPEKVDLFLCTAVLEHLSEPINFLKNAYANLKKWGYLLLTTPSIRSKPVLEFIAFRLKLINPIEISDHKEYYTKDKLVKYLEKAWFEKKNIKHRYFELYMNNFVLVQK
ncbi:MAG: hypothetical protein ACD_80C00152G0003 [uncultured bacterium (gcode 4)]|uniref:Methyltransferase type 11 n=1 Tax=uncultured bacterium (gcode 4) TaxID=1234023 RepID=K1YHD8_9BACT|nr:MAG: hypothetical protein ACD_80C00152G0003 [uncultured bacterium (gcode 4)]